MKKKFTDTEIIAAIKAGNATQELQYLYDTTQRKIRKYIVQNNGSGEEAQDVFQDSILTFFQHVLRGKFDQTKSIDGFLYSIARNQWINRAKKMQKQVSGSTNTAYMFKNTASNDYLSQKLSEERAEKVQSLLEQVGGRCKELLTYTVFYKMRMEEVAEKMELSGANAAKTQNYKCKQKLIQLIKDNGGLKAWLYE